MLKTRANCCSFCNGANLTEIVNFGNVALAGAFLKPDGFDTERKYPLRLWFCGDCFAVQVADQVPANLLFNSNYFYFSSSIGTLRAHFADYAEEVSKRFLDPPNASVLEFGCNDGVLLRPLADCGIRTVIGVDPATNAISSINDSRITVVNDFFSEATAKRIVAQYGAMDLVLANNVFAHISDIRNVTRAIHLALADDGVFIFEVHHLAKVVEELQYDMIYHEHLYYYSMLSVMNHVARYGMVVFDIKLIPIHGGSIRFYVCKKGSKHSFQISDAARALEQDERRKGYDRVETFLRFSAKVARHRDELTSLLSRLRSEGAGIAGYGASGRANTLLQYCGLDHRHLDFMIDDAPAKHGYFTPGSHLEICPASVLAQKDAPDYLLIFAWAFVEEIRNRNETYLATGGKMIIPLPKLRILAGNGALP
jgi:methylation protein EvaC